MIPLISIIVPNYNHAAFLKQRLDCIFNQTYQNFEVILLDDCSTDASTEILKKYAKNSKVSHCIFNESNSGNTFKQWAKGIALAKGEYIWIAESDDTCEATILEKLLLPLQKDSEVVLAYCQSNRMNERGEKTGNWITHTDDLDATLFLNDFTMDGNEFIERFLIFKNVIPNASAVLLRRVCIIQLGVLDFNPVLRTIGDWLLYFKLITHNKIAFIGESLNNFRYHEKSVSAKAGKKENLITLINVELQLRKNMITFLTLVSPKNKQKIIKTNNGIKKSLLYEKGVFHIRNNRKIKGGFILISVLDVFFKENKFRKGNNIFNLIFR